IYLISNSRLRTVRRNDREQMSTLDDKQLETVQSLPGVQPVHPVAVVRSYAGDPVMYYLLAKWNLQPAQLAAITFLLGFGVLSIWYAVLVYSRDVAVQFKGLYAYSAASWGDGLVLPLLSLIVAQTYRNHSEVFRGTSALVSSALNTV